MASTLIVPVNVAALAVGNPDTQGDDPLGVAENLAPMADFSHLPWSGGGGVHNAGPYVSAAVLDNSEPFEGQVPLLQGVHVHWALPDGLTNATAGESAISFPDAPNRWLVTRVVVSASQGSPATTALRSWVIESDRLNDAPTAPGGLIQPTVPLPPPAGVGQTFAYLGQAFDLATWPGESTAPRLTPLTAVGYGQPTFAAFYPNCSTVFGYYDALTDLTAYDPSTSTISYHVAGWYAAPATDPLAVAKATPATYGWSYTGSDAPSATMCAGIADAVPWNPATTYLAQAPGALSVAVAASTREAVSALMASVLQQEDPGQYPDAEQVLNALQFGLLSGSTNPMDALAEFEEEVHAAGFATLSSGPLWTVQAAGGKGSEATLPDAQAEALNALNVLQLQLNDASFELAALQFQLFVDWYKYELVNHSPSLVPPSLQGKASAVQTYVAGEATDVTTAAGEIQQLQEQVASAAKALEGQLASGLKLTSSTGAPRYYQPADPVLVLSGPDVTPATRYGNDGAGSPDGLLPCRVDSGLVTAATLQAGVVSGSAQAVVGADALPPLAAQPASAPSALLQALVSEAFFLAPGLQPALAAAVAAQGGTANPAVLDPVGTVAALRAAAAAFLGGTAPSGVAYTGTAPDALWLDEWAGTPWLPVLLQYGVELQPVQYLDPASGPASYPEGFINDQFAFDSGTIDLQYTGTAPTRSQAYSGTAILTPSATVDLAAQISTFLANTGNDDPELSAVLTALGGLPLLSQGLTGMTEALLMRGLTLQMPVADPLLPPPLQGSFVQPVAAAVGGQNATAPLPENSFNPIRAGIFTIRRLRLVDVFGRFRDYASPGVVVARGLAPPPRLGLGAGEAFLPPRITQPARLLFRWRAADDANVESNTSPATTPVLGWVMPNYLDRSLALYTAAGTPLGELALSADRARVLWTPAPGGDFPIGTSLETVLQGQNADLSGFALGAWNGGDATFFAPFFDAVREALTFSLPEQFAENAAQAVLAGQPLALARASLALDVAGPTATDESWTAFAAAVAPNGPPPTDGGLSQVRFPVTLGALDHLDDTLVGYWISPSDAGDYRTFYAPYATASQGGVAPPAQDTLTLAPQPSSAGAIDVVLLLDPRGSVHATTGILPVKEIDIPPAQYAPALASLAVTFETTPVLSGSTSAPQPGGAPAMLMVQPKVGSGSWSWVTTGGTDWSSLALQDAAASQLATLDPTPQRISEGWLRLQLPPQS